MRGIQVRIHWARKGTFLSSRLSSDMLLRPNTSWATKEEKLLHGITHERTIIGPRPASKAPLSSIVELNSALNQQLNLDERNVPFLAHEVLGLSSCVFYNQIPKFLYPIYFGRDFFGVNNGKDISNLTIQRTRSLSSCIKLFEHACFILQTHQYKQKRLLI
jgi:hypothetical protein